METVSLHEGHQHTEIIIKKANTNANKGHLHP